MDACRRRPWFLLAGLVSCGGSEAAPAPPPPAPPVVRIAVVGVFVAPAKADGRRWDGFGMVSPDVRSELARALSVPRANMIAAFGMLAARLTNDGISPPEPAGLAQIDRGPGYSETIEMPARCQDSYTCTWTLPPWRRVVLTDRVLVRVHIEDVDIKNNDDVGMAVLTSTELLDAARARGAPVTFPVADQTNKQLLSVTVAVAPE